MPWDERLRPPLRMGEGAAHLFSEPRWETLAVLDIQAEERTNPNQRCEKTLLLFPGRQPCLPYPQSTEEMSVAAC